MSYYANPEQRERLATGLRDLAKFIESYPGASVPVTVTVLFFTSDGTRKQQCAEIDAIAELIGAETQWAVGDHYSVSRHFGPVEYRAVAIPRQSHEE